MNISRSIRGFDDDFGNFITNVIEGGPRDPMHSRHSANRCYEPWTN